MYHVRPDFEGHRNLGGARRARETGGIGEQGFRRSHLDQDGREPAQVGMES